MRSTAVAPLELRAASLPGETQRDADPEAAARLLERLRARLGAEAVFSVCLVPEHRPELAWRVAEPALPGTGSASGAMRRLPRESPVGCAPVAPRPLWMLAEPQRLQERDDAPWQDGAPLGLAGGPERIESGWWDGRDVRRDYYVATGWGGVRLWVYRERDRGGWWLHGVFG